MATIVFSIAETYHNKTSKNIPFLRTVTVHATAVGFQDKVREEDAATQPYIGHSGTQNGGTLGPEKKTIEIGWTSLT